MATIGLKAKLRYRFDNLMARGTGAQILLLALLSLVPFVLLAKSRGQTSTNTRLSIIQDMGHQPRFGPQAAAPLFADGRAARLPVDGAVARFLHQESRLGVALDPIADKLLMTTAYLVLAFRDVVPWWITILVISRDVAIIMTAVVISLVAGYRPFRPSSLGKISTVMQVTTMFVAVSYAARLPWFTAMVVEVFMYLAATFTVASAVHYAIIVRGRYGQPAPEQDVTKPSN